MQEPSVGRIVHYVQYDGDRCCAAVITDVGVGGEVELHVFPHGLKREHQQDGVRFSEEILHGTWHWPERVRRDSTP